VMAAIGAPIFRNQFGVLFVGNAEADSLRSNVAATSGFNRSASLQSASAACNSPTMARVQQRPFHTASNVGLSRIAGHSRYRQHSQILRSAVVSIYSLRPYLIQLLILVESDLIMQEQNRQKLRLGGTGTPQQWEGLRVPRHLRCVR
jgi:hypothetical protein